MVWVEICLFTIFLCILLLNGSQCDKMSHQMGHKLETVTGLTIYNCYCN